MFATLFLSHSHCFLFRLLRFPFSPPSFPSSVLCPPPRPAPPAHHRRRRRRHCRRHLYHHHDHSDDHQSVNFPRPPPFFHSISLIHLLVFFSFLIFFVSLVSCPLSLVLVAPTLSLFLSGGGKVQKKENVRDLQTRNGSFSLKDIGSFMQDCPRKRVGKGKRVGKVFFSRLVFLASHQSFSGFLSAPRFSSVLLSVFFAALLGVFLGSPRFCSVLLGSPRFSWVLLSVPRCSSVVLGVILGAPRSSRGKHCIKLQKISRLVFFGKLGVVPQGLTMFSNMIRFLLSLGDGNLHEDALFYININSHINSGVWRDVCTYVANI